MSSQGREDAILADIFARIGTTTRIAVEVGARDGVKGSNTHALRLAGWSCVLLDSHPQAPEVHQVWLTVENIVPTFQRFGVPVSFDLLSIDVDGNDYHLWHGLVAYMPRVVVIEYNCHFAPDEVAVMPYAPRRRWDKTTYYGASAAALVALGRRKGYSLVAYTPRQNLIFVLDTARGTLPMLETLPPKDTCGYIVSPRRWEGAA